ncbi:DUF3500 domain-containing protein, partial [Verrucomicrobia bacterium]|nr:DUF3500 domain-containing protein [Verrucomicrobiota bacterium]
VMTFTHTSSVTRLSTLLAVLIFHIVFHPSLHGEGVESDVGKAFEAFEIDQIKDRSTKSMTTAAQRFLENLDEILIPKAKLPFNTPEKSVWSNLPPNLDYAGVRIADLSPNELSDLMHLLASSLSPKGFEKVRGIMLGDDLLVRGDQTGNRMLFGADNYWFFIYGTPSTTNPWGWQFDGHHLAINLTIVKDSVTVSPSFIGTQPADVEWGERYSHKPMHIEVAKAFQLVNSLDTEQKSKAIVGERRQNLDAGPGADDVQPPSEGIKGSQLNSDQRKELINLVSEWLEILPRQFADKRQREIKRTLDGTTFGWWGKTKQNSPIYFRIQGPEVLIEFANQNLGGNPLQHLHSVYRDPSNDYGDNF